jgi:crotonobetainyl-CoA:carnitine CoA-transferase CaiB-like acyl-CoA transferase
MLMKPLSGIRVLSLAINIPGPVAVARLHQLGASVVKVEPPDGDLLASSSPEWYAALHHGLIIFRLDLKSDAGQTQIQDLLRNSDLLITSNRLAALRRLNLDWPLLASRYPRLCQVAIIGYPLPNEARPGHDLTYLAGLGLLDPPHLPRTVLADLAGAEWSVSASLALLLGRERFEWASKNGKDVYDSEKVREYERFAQVSLAEAAEAFAQPLIHGLTAPQSLLGGGVPGYNLYQARDGWVAVAALERHFLERLQDELGLEKITRANLAEAFLARSADSWETWAIERDLPIAAVHDPLDLPIG